MKKIIYYVSSSIDGFIAGENDDISQFILEGNGVEKYQKDLLQFKTVIMGRCTYEFGYQYGLEPGQPAYPNMDHHIFSDSLKIENLADSVYIEKLSVERVQEIKLKSETDVYLCGGGQFAGWLLNNGLVDMLKVKLNPLILGNGTKLFNGIRKGNKWNLIEVNSFDDGMQILTYELKK